MDISEFRYPVEVLEAANGQPERLVEFLKSDKVISRRMRDALALLIAGELNPWEPGKDRK